MNGVSWTGDWVPSAEGHGGIDGDCPDCGGKLMWTGWGWSAHSQWHHAAVRRQLLRAVVTLLQREAELKAWVASLATDGLVGFRWRNGVYPGWQLEDRWELPREWWDTLDVDEKVRALRIMREHLTGLAREQHGVTVNPATWFHKIYETPGGTADGGGHGALRP